MGSCTHTHTHTHTCARVHSQTHTHACIHTGMHTRTFAEIVPTVPNSEVLLTIESSKENSFVWHALALAPLTCIDLSTDACFRRITSFGDPHYLSKTSPQSIQCAWNSRIWNFEFRKTLLPLRNLWNFAPCKRFRPVDFHPVHLFHVSFGHSRPLAVSRASQKALYGDLHKFAQS